MALARRVTAPAAPAGGSVNFGGDGFFTGALGLPEGNYAVTFAYQMFTPTKQDGTPTRTPPFLAVMGTFYPIDPATGASLGEPTEHPLNCGMKAHESFLPSEDGMGLVAVPNGKSVGMWNYSSWGMFFDSLKNAGLPPGLVTSSLEPLQGVWLHTMSIPEPEEKKRAAKKARATTGAAAMMGGAQEEDRDRQMTVVSEILEGGKPWEGTGGIPAEAPAPAPKVAPKAAPRGRTATPATPAAVDPSDEEAIGNATLEALSAVLGANPAGMMKVALKTQAFAAAKKAVGDEMAQAVMNTYLQADDTLGAALEELGYVIAGLKVTPKA